MVTKTVSSTEGLIAAVKAAKSGDVILLEAGQYSGVKFIGLQLEGVTIQSKDAAAKAVLTDLTVKGSSGLTFKDLELVVDPAKTVFSFNIHQSRDITLSGLKVHGQTNGVITEQGDGIMVRESSNIVIADSEFHHLTHALSHLDNDGLTVINNSFHHLAIDGMRGGGSSNVLVKGNSFTDFFPPPGAHPDGIQFWTTNTTEVTRNIIVTENVITRGDGGPVQGIFFRDTFDKLPYENITITNNLVIGGMYNGIMLDGGNGFLIHGNVVAGLPDQRSWIRLENALNGTLSDNISTFYLFGAGNSGVKNVGNQEIPVDPASSKGLFQAWLGKIGDTLDSLPEHIANLYAELPGTGWTPPGKPAPGSGPVAPVTELRGGDGADRLAVDGKTDMKLFGMGGDDTLTGGLGKNRLEGGLGNDTYMIRDADDLVFEAKGAGTDTVYASVNYTLTADVEVLRMVDDARIGTGNALDNRIHGSAGNDKIYGLGGADKLSGGAGADLIYGGDGNDEISGDSEADRLDGGEGNDRLVGGSGNDYLIGGGGADSLDGGLGADTLVGGLGADQFLFRPEDVTAGAVDRIEDFSRAQGDRILLSLLDANSNTAAVNDKFAFIGTQAFSKVAGQLRYEVKGSDAYVSGDVNGDGIADFTIRVIGVTNLAAGDFML